MALCYCQEWARLPHIPPTLQIVAPQEMSIEAVRTQVASCAAYRKPQDCDAGRRAFRRHHLGTRADVTDCLPEFSAHFHHPCPQNVDVLLQPPYLPEPGPQFPRLQAQCCAGCCRQIYRTFQRQHADGALSIPSDPDPGPLHIGTPRGRPVLNPWKSFPQLHLGVGFPCRQGN